MDDLKRSIYIEARRMIEEGEYRFVCWALHYALRDITGLEKETWAEAHHASLEEFFPEFFNLYDGVWWSFDRETPPDEDFPTSLSDMKFLSGPMLSKHSVWWEGDWRAPRLAVLDFIINNR